MNIFKRLVCWLFCLALSSVACAQTREAQDVSKSVRSFVQEFYDWYVPEALKNHVMPAWQLALKYRSSAFSPKLSKALTEDSAAQAKVTGEIVGLDFDPFLNSQDPTERYEVGTVAQKGDSYWVEVYGIWSGTKKEKPDVVAELQQRDRRWVFVNFHYNMKQYPDGGDLLNMLRMLREERQKHVR